MTSKYSLSPAMQHFVQQSEAFFPPSVLAQGIGAQRAAYNAMAAHFARPRPTSLDVRDAQLDGIPIRRYQAPQATATQRILFAHGGGWYLGGLDSHDGFCAHLARDCNVTVIAVDYRLAPEAPYPAALDDLSRVYQALLQEDDRPPLLLGDSAGGNLAAALALRCRNSGLPTPGGQVLIYPALATPGTLAAHQRFADAPLLDSASINACWQYYGGAIGVAEHSAAAELAPLQADSFASLPPTVILAAEFDPLVDDARQYSQRLRQAGGQARLVVIPGLVHGALHAAALAEEADQLYQSACSAVQQLCAQRRRRPAAQPQ